MGQSRESEFRNGRHVVYLLHAHIVLVTKYRRTVMTERVTALLTDTFHEVCDRFDVRLDACEADGDHIHLLISYPPKVSLSTLVMALKSNSARRVRAQEWEEITRALWGPHFWSPSYAVFSTGGAPLEHVKRYIENQSSPNRRPGRPRKTARQAPDTA